VRLAACLAALLLVAGSADARRGDVCGSGNVRVTPEVKAALKRDAPASVPPEALREFSEAAIAEGRDYPRAVQLYMSAAKAGHAPSARRLAQIYRDGVEGVGRDRNAASRWDREAARLGDFDPCWSSGPRFN
jgi:TPR repeat protein